MERTVPTTESEGIELYTRTYYSLLRSSAKVQIRTLEEVHAGMNSLLHPRARDSQPDMSAFIYSLLRLPSRIADTRLVVLGQTAEVFQKAGFGDVFAWEEVSAAARRRRCFYNGEGILACLIASRSDIDDLLPLLAAYQIEWNKFHQLLQGLPNTFSLEAVFENAANWRDLGEHLEVPLEDLDRLYAVWDAGFLDTMKKIAAEPLSLGVQLLNGSLSEYRRATNAWWENIEHCVPAVRQRPLYFVSSNTHSLINLLTGFPLRQQERLEQYLKRPGNTGLLNEWNDIINGEALSSRENFLYYVYKKYLQIREGTDLLQQQRQQEQESGIWRIPSRGHFDVEAQVIDLSRLNPAWFDPRLLVNGNRGSSSLEFPAHSDALILNIDYPLGLAAYNILSKVSESATAVLGVYMMGKAATLNGVVGDVMVPNVVHDEHSQNTFLFPNCFTAADVAPYLVFGTVLDNQKAVTVQGTFLQTANYMDVFYREGYTDIEMESGPFLSAIYEMYRPTRHPVNEIVNLYGLPFDLGLIHYASDRPLSKGRNLGAGSLSYFGMDSSYAVALAILRRIFSQEQRRT